MATRYVSAFNTGRADRLADMVASLYSPELLADLGGVDAVAGDRIELFWTYGPLDFAFADTTASPPIVWWVGRITNAYVGHQFHLDEEGQVRRHTTWRARPIPYPNRQLSVTQVADSMRAYLDTLASREMFSGSVVMSRRGERVLSGSWGLDGQPDPGPVDRDTRFHTASMTKLLTVTAFLQLAEAGAVRLDDRLARWVPEYPAPWRDTVRLRDLLTHTSGIELDDDAGYLARVRVARTAEDLLAAQVDALSGVTPQIPAGGEYDYTSEGVDLLGLVIERVTGRLWTEVLRERVLEPAGMRGTRFRVPLEEGNWALGTTTFADDLQSQGPRQSALQILPVTAKPSSGVWSSAEDLHRFMRAVVEGRLLGAAWTDSMLTPKIETGDFPKYGIEGWAGLGAQGEDLWGTRTVGHGGVVPGYSGTIEYLPENGWLLTVVSNTGEGTGFLVYQRFLELVANAVRVPSPETNNGRSRH
ncbi:MAG TPA: serine hydrolase domain-containing protein [Longimicrobiales bacterium]|nr:serine hydrolase domain-containing protein [Longimicrobiales bacterium]